MKIKTIKTRVFKPGDNLLAFIGQYIFNLREKNVLVVTSKVVALSEGRLVGYKNKKHKEKVIKADCESFLKTKHILLTIKDGVVMANAGVDESNADGHIILLPRDSFKTAEKIRKYFCDKYKVKELGVVITDSRSAPLRAGITGVAVGHAGFAGIKSYKNALDIFGRPFKHSRVNVADSLAAAAVLCMGEGNERKPLALIQNAPLDFCEKINKKELKIDIKKDMYGPIFRRIK